MKNIKLEIDGKEVKADEIGIELSYSEEDLQVLDKYSVEHTLGYQTKNLGYHFQNVIYEVFRSVRLGFLLEKPKPPAKYEMVIQGKINPENVKYIIGNNHENKTPRN